MSSEVRRLDESDSVDRKLWRDFVHASNNGTLFHLPEFLDYHAPGRFRNHHLLATGSDGCVEAMMTGALVEREGETWLWSYPGASWGGPVTRDDVTLSRMERILEAIADYCRDQGWAGMGLTLPPQPYFRRFSNYTDFVLVKRGFGYQKRELTAVIDLRRFGDDPELGFAESARRGVRKALRNGLVFEESSDFSSFYPVLESNLQQRHNVRPTHTLAELERIRSLTGDSVRQFVVRDGESGQVYAGMVMFHCNPRVTLAFYISHDDAFQSLRPVNLLYSGVIGWARDLGYHFLDLGTYTLNMEVNYGLCRFKESFSARGFFRNTFLGRV
ncbi:GNAT family N-acetyltransferase [Candidatus Fermentibacterales bacterium]|nr:GNAT family N-acetyltransferase [Candidatus Fermentibacterales bacterium]